MALCPKPTTTGTSFGNFIYTTVVCNDTPLSQTISSLKVNLSLEDMKEANFTGVSTPKLIIKPDLFWQW